MIRIVFFDIDGTLVEMGRDRMTADTVRALDALRANGVKAFIASGRHTCIMNNLHGYPFDGYVCTNGALVLIDGRSVYSHPVMQEDSEAIARIAREWHIPCVAYHEGGVCINFIDSRAERLFELLHIAPPEVVDLVGFVREHPVYEFTPFIGAEDEILFTPHLRRTVFVRWHSEFVDLNPDDISKAVGIQKVLDLYGFTREESMSFGDGANDIQMLEYAGVGVAMGNAPDSVKCRADYVTAPVSASGVSAALRHFGLI